MHHAEILINNSKTTMYVWQFNISKYFLNANETMSYFYIQYEDKPSLSNENMLINELIREYLEFNKYKYTLSVLMTGEHITTEVKIWECSLSNNPKGKDNM